MKKKVKNHFHAGQLVVSLLVLISAFFMIIVLSKHIGTSISDSDFAVHCSHEGRIVGANVGQIDKTIYTVEDYEDEMIRVNVSKDDIPVIDNPKYISVTESEFFLDPHDPVFIVEASHEILLLPQKIMVWHQVVNGMVDGQQASIVYSPLTGSVVGLFGTVGGRTLTFGSSGKLLNSNIVLYDRKTESEWSQILAKSVEENEESKTIKTFPVDWSTWELAKARYPDARVLSSDTGVIRPYGDDPYGSYLHKNTYYQTGGPFFSRMNTDGRLDDKEIVLGLKKDGSYLGILKSKIKEEGAVNTTVGGYPVVAVHDCSTDSVRVYSRMVNGEEYRFYWRAHRLIDQNGEEWSIRGAYIGRVYTDSMSHEEQDRMMKLYTEKTANDAVLEWIPSFDVMWFAWSAFYPSTELYR